jgi:transcription elongation factor GreA
MSEEHEYLTKEKYEEFKGELHTLKTVRRKEVAENLEYAKGLGDLSENAEYHEARDMQASVEDRIAKLEMIMKSATIVSTHDTSVVSIGSVLTVHKEGEKEKKVFTIVGSEEADSTVGKISVKSPFGVAAMGKKKSESFSFSTPSGTMSYKIVEIK